MKNANRNIVLAATTALAIVVAPSAPADDRVRLNPPQPPSPREVMRSFPAPPTLQVADRDRGGHSGGRDRGYDSRNRGNDGNRYNGNRDYGNRNDGNRYNGNRNDGYRSDGYRYDGNRSDRDRGGRNRNDGRWSDRGRYRDDRYRPYYGNGYRHDSYRSYRGRGPSLRVWVDGRWLLPPFPGAIWIDGYFDEWGDWVPGHWAQPGYGYEYGY